MKKWVLTSLISLNLLIFFPSEVRAENKHLIDSIEFELKQITNKQLPLNSQHALRDTLEIKLLIQLAELYIYNKPNVALEKAERALVLAQKIQFKKGSADAYNCMGVVKKEAGDYDEAMKLHLKSLTIRLELKDKKGVANSLNNIGIVYKEQDNYPKALHYYTLALRMNTIIKDARGMAKLYGNIGNVYKRQKKFDLALRYLLANLKIISKGKDLKALSAVFGNIGGVLAIQNNRSKALLYHFASLRLAQKINDKPLIAGAYNNIGGIYRRQKNYKQALEMFFASLKIKKELKDKRGVALTFEGIGNTYYNLHQYAEAHKYLDSSLFYAKKIKSWEPYQLVYSSLAILDSARGDFKRAVENYTLQKKYNDSIQDDENSKERIQTQLQHEFDTKAAVARLKIEKAEAISKMEIQNQKLIRNSFLSGFFLVLIIALGILQNLRLNQKAKILIGRQKELVELKNQEILASIAYARRLQNAILPASKLVKEYLLESFLFYRPKDIVAGDFYWFYPLKTQKNEDLILFAVADCTGHGVPGAMLSVVCANALNNAVKELSLVEPGQILDAVSTSVVETLVHQNVPYEDIVQDGMDISLCALNLNTLQIQWSGANNPLVLIQQDFSDGSLDDPSENLILAHSDNRYKLIEIKPNKQPVGLFADRIPFTTHTLQLKKGEMLYLFSDGYADQFGGNEGKKLLKKNFKNHLLLIAELPIEEQFFALQNHFDAWKGSFPQVDDVCVIGVRV